MAQQAGGAASSSSSRNQPGAAVAAMDLGEVKRAIAFRVKYRLSSNTGHMKRRLALNLLGVHPQNRGGVYPQGDVVKNLGIMFARTGFSQEEADHQGVCVQEPPQDGSAVAESYAEYNRSNCRGQQALEKCFGSDSIVSYGMLSHNHLLLVLLCWANNAEWELDDSERDLLKVQADGQLNLDSAVAVENLTELVSSCREGLKVEVLSWKINVEEPEACALISTALNSNTALALRTTELTALSVLSGECALQCRTTNSDLIEFGKIREKLRHIIPTFVDEPEFKEFFEFVINLGAHKAQYIPDLLKFGSRFVNQKHRQLRLHAFAEVNKINMQCPRAKIAAIKRSYRKNPSYGFCPAPEPKFHKANVASLLHLEELLHYFHQFCHAAVAALGAEHIQQAFLANVDVAAAEAFCVWPDTRPLKELQGGLLAATWKYYDQLRSAAAASMPTISDEKYDWIIFKPPRENKKATTTAVAETKVLPKVIEFDNQTGLALSSQDQRGAEKQQAQQFVLLPWRQWHANASPWFGRDDSLMRSALQVLYMLHLRQDYGTMPIDILLDDSKNTKFVQATETIPVETLMLAPCVPKAKTLAKDSIHPWRVPITVALIETVPSAVADSDGSSAAVADKPKRVRISEKVATPAVVNPLDATPPAAVAARTKRHEVVFYVTPEWKSPMPQLAENVDDGTVEWTWLGDESMHPYWTIRRLQTSKEKGLIRNMQYKDVTFTCVTVGSMSGSSVVCTYEVTVPFLTNTREVPRNAELILEIEDPKKPEKRSRNWKDSLQEEEKRAQQGKQAKSSKPKGKGTELEV